MQLATERRAHSYGLGAWLQCGKQYDKHDRLLGSWHAVPTITCNGVAALRPRGVPIPQDTISTSSKQLATAEWQQCTWVVRPAG